MDVDMKTKEEPLEVQQEKSRDAGSSGGRERKDRDRDYDRDKDRDRDRDRDRDHGRDRRESGRSRRAADHWEPESRNGDRRKRSRSRSRSRRRSASPKRRSRRSRSHSRSPRSRSGSRSRDRDRGGKGDTFTRSLGGPINADHEEAVEFAKVSKRENRVYVGNLSYEVRYRDLMEFMRGAGEVLFAEVLVTPTGVSKGCGIVEFASIEDAQRAIRELSEAPLLGRPVFIREDRENEARFGATPVPGKIGAAMAGQGLHSAPPPRPPSHNYFGAQSNPGNQLYVGNLPYQAGWQDLKDLFRVAGNIIRADINLGADGRPKGSGTVVFETSKDAQAAISKSMYHGTEWYGRTLEVREDRYAGLSGPGGFRGGLRGSRGLGRGLRGIRGGGFRGGGGGGGGYGGGGGGGGAGGRDFSNQDLYADYSGPDQGGAYAAPSGYGGGFGGGAGAGGAAYQEEPSQQIMVRNLPWSTANEDLVELFETTGQVELAEILFDGTRSKGCGVVQFSQVTEAETAIAKFQHYMYGGRPLDVRFNDRWHTFTPTAAKGGQVAQADMV
ncbi:hypothetical protein GGX14DRAFT_522510 [Mycena pura]|uniref:RRM domain-containing protein n=1 Tax=Mycena pura TaxID=153505 RepID=A0AAD6V907_9AGAR|nr:hypothetical protein GGX14DRAFT_522510 [Mycena pura]